MSAVPQLQTNFSAMTYIRRRVPNAAVQIRRLLALAQSRDGATCCEAAKVGGVTVRDSVDRFNAQGPEELLYVKAPGERTALDDVQRQKLHPTVEKGPITIYGVKRWKAQDLARLLSGASYNC